MVYIDRNGQVWEKRPWDLQRVLDIFIGLWAIILQFFITLTAPFRNIDGGSNNRRGGWNGGHSGWGGGGGGGGGGSGGGGGGGSKGYDGLRPNRRIGRVVNTSMDCNIPGGG